MSTKPVIVISGGSSGIGLAIASRFAVGGYRVALIGRTESHLDTAAREVREATGSHDDVLPVLGDLAAPSLAAECIAKVREAYGRIDVLVNAAGHAANAAFEAITLDEFEQTYAVNMRAMFRLTQEAWSIMKQQRMGVVINISSLAALSPFPGFTAYGASKAWVDLFTKAIANEGQGFGIRAFAIRPGAVETPMLRGLFPDFPADQTVAPEEVAEVAWAMVGEAFRFSSGQAINVTRQPGS
jgi:NAD(P)-dependent dehydrogenase (short-subunit alcohol dehydrogenase family)